MTNFDYDFPPYDHQKVGFELSAEQKSFALLMEMGTGKSKIMVDTLTYNVERGVLDAICIVAPKGVHSKWLDEDFPMSMRPSMDWEGAVWRSGHKQSELDCSNLLKSKVPVKILCVNTDVFSYPKSAGAKLAMEFVTKNKTMLVVDESQRIKNPDSNRTKVIDKLGDRALYKRILSGTPITNGVFDLYSQFNFLNPRIFGQSFFAFKHTYAEIMDDTDPIMIAIKRKLPPGRFPPVMPKRDANNRVMYKNLDKLQEVIRPYSYRVLKSECLDLPEKIYSTRYYDLDSKQAKIYEDLKKSLRTQLMSETITILHKMTLLLRLQQVVSGYLPNDDGHIRPIYTPEDNPRLQLLLETLEDIDGQVIIWARFQEEIRMIAAALGDDCVTYYGETKNREEQLAVYKSGGVRYIVGSAAAGGIGLNLTNASTVIYYSNDFNYGSRAQSEDRAHRIGQKDNVLYIDLEARGTVDKYIIEALRAKKDVADNVVNFTKEGL